MQGTFIEAKGVYRVENEDGSFSTYTPEQYRELRSETVLETKEEETKEEEKEEEKETEDEDPDVILEDNNQNK